MRQLLWMAEGHDRGRWAHTSLICALIANTHRDPRKGRAFKPADFDPYARRKNSLPQHVASQDDLKLLRQALERTHAPSSLKGN